SGLIDTGADHTLINKLWAKALGVEWKGGVKTSSYGISGSPNDIYLHEVEIEIPRLSNSRRTILVGFIDSKNVGILLGQVGFFDNFKVTFQRYNNLFEVEAKP
ncbi:MAG: hypothetical protein WD182_09275, partial [Bacteroidota bacterium]